MATKETIAHHMARAFFASAWADECEESDNAGMISGREIMEVMPDEIDPAAIGAAQTLCERMERENGRSIGELFAIARALSRKYGEGDRPRTEEYFGHYCAMQAMGHGVGLWDAFGSHAYESVKVPHLEFGIGSLSREYFNREGV